MKPTLSQIDFLIQTLRNDEIIAEHFDLTDAWERLRNITEKQLKYIHFLIIKRKRFKLNKILSQFLKWKQ